MSGAKAVNVYSNQFYDDHYEYKNIKLSDWAFAEMPKGRLLSEEEWRDLGVKLESGWEHYDIHSREPNILMMRKKIDKSSSGPSSEVKK